VVRGEPETARRNVVVVEERRRAPSTTGIAPCIHAFNDHFGACTSRHVLDETRSSSYVVD